MTFTLLFAIVWSVEQTSPNHRVRVHERSTKEGTMVYVLWGDQNIAPYLYGRSSRILPQDQRSGQPDWRDLYEISRGISPKRSMFGVRLTLLEDGHAVEKGDCLLELACYPTHIGKRVLKVDSVKVKEDYPSLRFTSLWPSWGAGFQGFFPLSAIGEVFAEDVDRYHSRLYLKYEGKLPGEDGDRQPGFFEQVMTWASELSVLIECWAMVMDEKLRNGNILSFDPFERYWLDRFERRHRGQFQHERVWRALSTILEEQDLRGINRIFNDRHYPRVDLITPLLDRMQDDILQAMRADQSLVLQVFSENSSRFWKKRLQIIFERYYGPREVIIVSYGSKPQQPLRRNLGDKRLKPIEVLILRGATAGERAAARAAYERVAGVPYVH